MSHRVTHAHAQCCTSTCPVLEHHQHTPVPCPGPGPCQCETASLQASSQARSHSALFVGPESEEAVPTVLDPRLSCRLVAVPGKVWRGSGRRSLLQAFDSMRSHPLNWVRPAGDVSQGAPLLRPSVTVSKSGCSLNMDVPRGCAGRRLHFRDPQQILPHAPPCPCRRGLDRCCRHDLASQGHLTNRRDEGKPHTVDQMHDFHTHDRSDTHIQ